MTSSNLLQIRAAGKSFSGVRVLDDVSLDLARGEVLGLIGENGAGKSTLIKILAGIHAPDGGEIRIDGQAVAIRSPARARRLGISLIPQEFNLIPTLNVTENVFLGSEWRRGPLLDRRGMQRRAAELLARLHTDVSPTARLDDLSVARRQMVEIAKALVHDARLLIMDEPTTVLTEVETGVLFDLVRRLRADGVAVIFVSHKLREVIALCDRVAVLRDGRLVGVDKVADVDEHTLATRMVGRELSQVFPVKSEQGDEVALEVEGLSVAGKVHDVSFTVRRGEVLGFAGLVGSGRTEMAEALVGVRRRSAGTVRIGGCEVRIRSPRDAIAHGLAYLSEDRQGKGLVMDFGIPENITLASLRRYSHGLIRRCRERAAAEAYTRRFHIAAARRARVRTLSGGNQQKVYLAKCVDTQPRVFILDEPTRGVDVGAKHEIYRFIQELARSGLACLVISSELEEVLGLCTRVAVMREGRLAAILDGARLTEREIMLHATGALTGSSVKH